MKKKFIENYKKRNCLELLYKQLASWNTASQTIIVIPAYKETYSNLMETLDSLSRVDNIEEAIILLLINYQEGDSTEITDASFRVYDQLTATSPTSFPKLELHLFIEKLSGKHKGVGLARKHLMDCAFLMLDSQNRDGLIINLDADTTVQSNYLYAIKSYFLFNKQIEAASIFFEHPIDKDSTSEHEAIINYELHLRYFINMQRWLELPYAIQTIGSAMAVRSEAYAKEGGMAVRQAGEDFYFMHKYSKTLRIGEINNTAVIPSARVSDRVPFGTGKAISDQVDTQQSILSYNPESFKVIKNWLDPIYPLLAAKGKSDYSTEDNHEALQDFLVSNKFYKAMDENILSSAPGLTRVKKFFEWFDAFRLFKLLHYLRDHSFPNENLETCCSELFRLNNWNVETSRKDYLLALRERDKQSSYYHQWSAAFISKLSSTSAS